MPKTIYMVAGLGNPGAAYRNTRHNLGFRLVDHIADVFSIPVTKKRGGALYGFGSFFGKDLCLVKPQKYMNRSGPPLREIFSHLEGKVKELWVIHDDMDIDFGRIKIKEKGGHGGHKGVKSIMDALGGGDFPRIRLGIGRPDPGISVVDFVLEKFPPQESALLGSFMENAREALETVLEDGITAGMNAFNRKLST